MNPFYNASGNPVPGAAGLSAIVRAEFAAIATAFGKMPSILTGNAGKLVVVNSTEDGLTVSPVAFPGPAGPFLPVAGGTVVGDLTLSGAGTGLTVANNALFGGTLTAAGGGTFSGTFAGTPTFTGTPLFSAAGAGSLAINSYAWLAHLGWLQIDANGGGTIVWGPGTSNAAGTSPIYATVNVSGTSVATSPTQWLFSIPTDRLDSSASPNGYFGASWYQNIDGANGARGSHTGSLMQVTQDGAYGITGGSSGVGVLNAWFFGSHAVTGGPNNIVFNPQIVMSASSSGWALAELIEGSINLTAGGGQPGVRGGVTMFSDGGVTGLTDDYAYGVFNNGPGTVPWGVGLQFGRKNASSGPMAALIQAVPQTNSSPVTNSTAGYGVDFSTVNFSTYAWASPGAAIGPNGTHYIGGGQITPGASGVSIDVANYIASSPTISVAGNLYSVGDHVYDTHGGILNVTSVGGSGNITAVAYLAGAPGYSYGGTGPATMAVRGGSGSQTAVIGVTWTQQTALAIQPTAGGKLGFNGATPIVKPTGVAVTAAGIHAALTSLGLIAP